MKYQPSLILALILITLWSVSEGAKLQEKSSVQINDTKNAKSGATVDPEILEILGKSKDGNVTKKGDEGN